MASPKKARARMSVSAVKLIALVAVVALVKLGSARAANINQLLCEGNRDGSAQAHGTAEASERLMKELREILKSGGVKNGVFSVELENGDNLYEWNVKLFIINPGQFHEELQQFKRDGEEDHILLRMSFSDNYPNEPPFVRVIYPVLTGGHVFENGEFCMELLTKQGWVRAYDAETLIVSLIDLLAYGKTEVDPSKGIKDIREFYTLEQARAGFERKSKLHEKHGWR